MSLITLKDNKGIMARQIARALFTDGFGERASRLQMKHRKKGSIDEIDGSGWCESAAVKKIEEVLDNWL